MSTDLLDNADMLRDFRVGEADTEELQELMQVLRQQEIKTPRPDTSDVFDDYVWIPDDLDTAPRTWNINGHRVPFVLVPIVNMLHAGLSPIVVIVGKEQKGKSSLAVWLMHLLHEKINALRGTFDPYNDVIYDVSSFLMWYLTNLRGGALYEEADETVGKNTYNSRFNRSVASTLRTQGKRQNLNLFVCPELDMLDPRIVDKADFVIEKLHETRASVTRYSKRHAKRSNRGLDYNFQEYPDLVDIPKPPDDLWERYDEVDSKFKGNFLTELLLDVLEERIAKLEEQNTAVL